jgi:hypothetical protein
MVGVGISYDWQLANTQTAKPTTKHQLLVKMTNLAQRLAPINAAPATPAEQAIITIN